MATDSLRSYFKNQQTPPQWGAVLRAMSVEMATQAEAQDLRDLFFRVGERFAADMEVSFQNVQTLSELETNLNDFWAGINWGWVTLVEAQDSIDISHQCAPLAAAFGDEALPWSVGVLEGFYQTLFTWLGGGDEMRVSCVGESPDGMDIFLRFGRKKK